MKSFNRIVLALLAMLAIASPASAQFRWGVKVGMDINKMSTDISTITDSENRTGFTGGLTSEFTIPIIGIGFDASLMYTHRTNNYTDSGESKTFSNDYISLPINLKYKISIPVISNFIAPYVFTGPEFAFLCSKKAITSAWKNKSVDTTWNLGVGVQALSRIQIAASYGIGLGKFSQYELDGETIDLGRTKVWTVTLAYFF